MKTRKLYFLSLLMALLPVQGAWAADTDVPGKVTNIRLVDNNDGTVTLTWDAVGTQGANGGTVDPTQTTYNIYSSSYDLLVSGLSKTTYTFSGIVQTDKFSTLLYRLTAVNSAGESEFQRSPFLILGPSLALPFVESTPAGKAQQEWWTEQNAYDPFQSSTAGSADNDGGTMAWYTQTAGEDATTSSGKISLKGSDKPVLRFSYYAVPGQQTPFDVIISRAGRQDVTILHTDFATLSGQPGWQNATLPLSDMLSDEYIQVRFHAFSNQSEAATLLIDNIRIYDQPDNNLSLRLNAPAKWNAGKEAQLQVGISNLGRNDATGYNISLYANGEHVSTTPGPAIPAGADALLTIPYTPTVNLGDQVALYVSLEEATDDDPSDDQSPTVRMALTHGTHAAPTSLTAETDADGHVSLAWEAPTTYSERTTESFEDYAHGAIDNIGAWSLIDRDGKNTFGIQGIDFPNEVEPKAFVVVNPEQMEYDPFYVDVPPSEDPTFRAHTGEQYLISFNPDTWYDSGAQADDWLISPRLSGEEQTISLWARSFDEYTPETFELYYSTTDAAPERFERLDTHANVPAQWTEYTADLSEGTTYFAVRVVSKDCWALFVDDVTFTPAASVVNAYNIYRDGQFIATVDAATTYTDTTAPQGSHTYAVSAVYDEGESDLSDTATATATATDGIHEATLGNQPFDSYTVDGIQTSRHATTLDNQQVGIRILRYADGRVVKTVPRHR